MKPSDTPNESFDISMSRLEELVAELERGTLSLDESLKKYEEGIKLLRSCETFLKNAEQRVQVLMQDDHGGVKMQEFDPDSDDDTSPGSVEEDSSTSPEKGDDDDIPF